MSVDIVSCPENENSTECLLRALLRLVDEQGQARDAEFNWDPIAFAFTVPIGIFAALFTLAAIAQTIIAAGAGRRKSSREVIGRWSEGRQTQWNMSEFRMSTVVSTPVLRTSIILNILDSDSDISFDSSSDPHNHNAVAEKSDAIFLPNWMKSVWRFLKSALNIIILNLRYAFTGRLSKRNLQSPKEMQAKASQASQARWLALLHELGLENLQLQPDEMEINAADYLPDDLKAVPAYGEVGCILSLAAAAGVSSLRVDPESQFPITMGRGFQLDFREHPLLGRVGVFARYGRALYKRPTKEEIRLTLIHAEGQVEVQEVYNAVQKVENANQDDVDPGNDTGTEDASVKIRRLLNFRGSGDDYEFLLFKIMRHPDSETQHCSCWKLMTLPTMFLQDRGIFWLLVADTPKIIPAVFPSRSLEIPYILKTLALQTKRFAGFISWQGQNSFNTLLPVYFRGIPIIFERRFDQRIHQYNDNDACCYTYDTVFRLAFRFLAKSNDFEDWWNAQSTDQIDDHRRLILMQLQQLDKLLRVGKGPSIICQKMLLYRTALSILSIDDAIADGRLDPEAASSQRARRGQTPSPNDRFSRTGVFGRFALTLEILDVYLAPPSTEDDQAFERQRTSFFEVINNNGFEFGPAGSAFYLQLQGVVDACKRGQSGSGNDDQSNRHKSELKDKDIVNDIIIWRAILLGLLFWTAPDNSAVLNSGLWKQVIPLL